MEDTRITFETAKLAKEKGFKYSELSYYDGELDLSNCFDVIEPRKRTPENMVYAPTQSLLAKWLREKHNIHLIAYKNINIDGYDWCYITTDGITNINSYKTYEEALEAGLQEALKLIK